MSSSAYMGVTLLLICKTNKFHSMFCRTWVNILGGVGSKYHIVKRSKIWESLSMTILPCQFKKHKFIKWYNYCRKRQYLLSQCFHFIFHVKSLFKKVLITWTLYSLEKISNDNEKNRTWKQVIYYLNLSVAVIK